MMAGTNTPQPASDLPPGLEEDAPSGGVLTYSAGLLFAAILSGMSFVVARTDLLWAPGMAVGLAVLAVAQMGVHLVFFLNISTRPDHTNNVMALAFGLLIVGLVMGGSLWIMANLNANMMPASAMREMQR